MKTHQQGNPRSAKKPKNVFIANLLDPKEVEFLTRENPLDQKEKLRGHWLLDGTVSRNMYAALVDNFPYDLAARFTVFPTPTGAAYAVITTQLGSSQHRFVLPLFESKAIDFLTSLSRGPLNICLGTENEEDARTYDCAVSQDVIKLVLDLAKSLNLKNTPEFNAELPTVLGLLLSPDLIPNISLADEVREIYVSVLMPTRAQAGPSKDKERSTS